MKKLIGVGFIYWCTSVFAAGFSCNQFLSEVAKQRETFETMEAHFQSAEGWRRIIRQPLTAAEQELRDISSFIDNYLFIGDLSPILSKYDPAIRMLEKAVVERERNLQSLVQLIELQRSFSSEESLSEARQRIIKHFREADLSISDRALSQSDLSTHEDLLQVVASAIKSLEGNIRQHEAYIGTHADEYIQVREHLEFYLEASLAEILDTVQRADARSSGFSAHLEEAKNESLESVQVAADPKLQLKALWEKVRAKIADFAEVRAGLSRFRTQFADVNLSPSEALREYLLENKILTEEMSLALNADLTKDGSRKLFVELLTQMIERIEDAEGMIENALKAQSTLGLQLNDFEMFPQLLGRNGVPPLVSEVQRLTQDVVGIRLARASSVRQKQVARVREAWLFLGKVTEAFGSLARAITEANHVFFQGSNIGKVIDWHFKQLYDHEAKRQYGGDLLLLRRMRGSYAKKLQVHLILNAKSESDDFLVTCARSLTMRSTWENLKFVAKAKKEAGEDSFGIYDRLMKAEEKAKEYGDLETLDDSGYAGIFLITSGKLTGSALTASGAAYVAKMGIAALWNLIASGWGATGPSDDDSAMLIKLKDDLETLTKACESPESFESSETPAARAERVRQLRGLIQALDQKIKGHR